MNQYDPYSKYISSTVSLTSENEFDSLELVEPSHPMLTRRASQNPFSTDIDWKYSEGKMIELMDNQLGMGLSANQVGLNYRMFVMHHSVLGKIGIYNPELLDADGEAQIEEGCLTWPLLYIKLARAERIKVRYTKSDGVTQVETWMDGMDARCFLHELDHLNGVVFMQHAGPLKLKRAQEKRDKLFKKLAKSIKH